MSSAATVFPTKGNLISLKKSLTLAQLGFDLLDRKRNILIREMMALIDQASRLRDEIDQTYTKAYLALQRANVTLGVCDEIAQTVPIENGLSLSSRSVMGVELPIVKLETNPLMLYYGFSATNSELDKAFMRFDSVKKLTAELAQIENSVYRLAVAIKKTQRRANALKNIIIPRFEHNVKYIADALEEKEREEFSRLKVIKSKKSES